MVDWAATAHRTRRQELLSIAADLFAARGFHNVTVDDIGGAAGVSGPALYHHFTGKEALLGEMLVAISRHLLDGARALSASDAVDLLERLILFHCEFAVDNRSLITVHFRDLIYATADDAGRVRRLQSSYATLWVDAVLDRVAGIDEPRARAAVHATFGLINSTPYTSGLSRSRMVELLSTMASNGLLHLR